MNTKIGLKEFFDLCASHDWYYSYSDDQRVWRKGQVASGRLSKMAYTSEEHEAIYDAWQTHMFSGVNFGRKETPKPQWKDFI